MTAYANDPRVARLEDGGYDVAEYAGDAPTWRVHEYSRYQYDVILRRRDNSGPFTLGHYGDADAAIHSLIGGPR